MTLRSKKKNLNEFSYCFPFSCSFAFLFRERRGAGGGDELATGGVWQGRQGRHHRVSDHRVSLGGRVEEKCGRSEK